MAIGAKKKIGVRNEPSVAFASHSHARLDSLSFYFEPVRRLKVNGTRGKVIKIVARPCVYALVQFSLYI